MMSHARDLLILNSDKDVQQVYYFLTVLRCLWLRDNLPNQWAAVLKLVSNLEQRRGTRVYNFNQTYVVDTLEHFGVNQFSELEIQTVCGIFDSNAFESSESSRAPCRGLYLMSSLINSSCLPNTRHYFKVTCVLTTTSQTNVRCRLTAAWWWWPPGRSTRAGRSSAATLTRGGQLPSARDTC